MKHQGNSKALVMILTVLLASVTIAAAQSDLLKGKVHYLEQAGVTLTKMLSNARSEFSQAYKSDTFFTVYVFESRHTIRMRDKRDSNPSFYITTKTDKMKLRRGSSGRQGYSIHTEDNQGGPVGLILMHKISGNKTAVNDAQIIDLNCSYDFKEYPVFWMGEAELKESFNYLTGIFSSGDEDLQDTLLHVIGAHDLTAAGEFLHQAALGSYSHKVRKNAIFWIGNLKNSESTKYLNNIYKSVSDTKLREQVVFALHISDQDSAPREMIRIARTDDSKKVRKSAVFWLGQKASEESMKFLKGIVETDSADKDLKDSAVFAISQLPKDKSVPMLIDIAKTNPSASVRKKAIFWLGQTGSEEALQFFEEILFKK